MDTTMLSQKERDDLQRSFESNRSASVIPHVDEESARIYDQMMKTKVNTDGIATDGAAIDGTATDSTVTCDTAIYPLSFNDIVADIQEHVSKKLEAKKRIELRRQQLLASAEAVKNAFDMAIDSGKWVLISIPSMTACYYLRLEGEELSCNKRFNADVRLDCKVTKELISRVDGLVVADGGRPDVLKLGLAEWSK